MRLLARLDHPRTPWIVAAIAVVLASPSLVGGIAGDDYLHRAILLGTVDLGWDARPLWNLFTFVPAGEGRDALVEMGIVPWWAHPDLHLEFFRPLTALTHMLDYALWPHALPLQHAHSLGWFGLAVLLVALVYRKVHGATVVAGLAALLFALEDAHAMPAAWLANRNSLIALSFGAGALLAHIQWRRSGRLGFGALAVTLLAVGQTAGEATIGVLAYLVAWQLTMDRGGWPRRLAVIAPYLAVIVAWRLTYSALGYEVIGSGLYVDPLAQPLPFLVALAERWPLLMAAQWWQLTADAWAMFSEPVQLGLSAASGLLCVPVLALSWRVLRQRAEARFWAVGMVLSLVPLCAAFPMNRLLIFCGVGAAGLLALVAADAGWVDGAREGVSRLRRWTSGGLLVLHGPVAALLLVAGAAAIPAYSMFFGFGARDAPADPGTSAQTLVYVNGQEFPVAYSKVIRDVAGDLPAPRRVALLSSMNVRSRIHRLDEHTLEIEMDPALLAMDFDRLMRSLDLPFEVGDHAETSDYRAEVLAVSPDGRPARASFRFREPLEHPEYLWVCWRDGALVDFPLPAVGETVELPPVSMIAAALPPGCGLTGCPREKWLAPKAGVPQEPIATPDVSWKPPLHRSRPW